MFCIGVGILREAMGNWTPSSLVHDVTFAFLERNFKFIEQQKVISSHVLKNLWSRRLVIWFLLLCCCYAFRPAGGVCVPNGLQRKRSQRRSRMPLVPGVWRSFCASPTCTSSTRPFSSVSMASFPTFGRRNPSSPPTLWGQIRTWQRHRWASMPG